MVKKHDPAVIEAEENLLIDFQFLLQEALTENGISLGELAKRAGLSKGRISQLMGPDANPTIKNMARLFHSAGETLCVSRGKVKLNAEPRQKWNWTVEAEALTAATNDNYNGWRKV